MATVLIQINNNKVYELLKNLEDLHPIKLLKKNKYETTEKKSMTQFWGTISDDTAQKLHAHVRNIRHE